MLDQKISHYQVEELLGSGGMGMVYRARDLRLGRAVALKVLKPGVTDDPDRRRRFMQEARSASSITHPSIAQIYDVGEESDVTYIAMELVEGKSVRQLVNGRELDLLASLEIGLKIAEGLARAHASGLVHRDIKSDNVMVSTDGHVKLLDFGLAKLMDTGLSSAPDDLSNMETIAHTQVGTVLGTVAYMSPEQARGRAVDHRSDIFSLGIVLYEMVTGELPFKGDSPLDTMHAVAFEEVRPVTIVRQNLPPELQRILSRCLRKKPEDRYPDAAALSDELKALKRDVESGLQRSLPRRRRLVELFEWAKYSAPQGWAGVAVSLIVLVALGYLIFEYADWGTLILILLIGLPLYRYVRNRRSRMVKRFVAGLSRLPEVRAVTVRGNQIVVVVDSAQARVFMQVNSLLEWVNRKQYFGDPLEAAVRDDLTSQEENRLLREPGVAYVREGVPQPMEEA